MHKLIRAEIETERKVETGKNKRRGARGRETEKKEGETDRKREGKREGE